MMTRVSANCSEGLQEKLEYVLQGRTNKASLGAHVIIPQHWLKRKRNRMMGCPGDGDVDLDSRCRLPKR
jgi:hypothetical protein